MTRFFCNGKKGYCSRVNDCYIDCDIDCTSCEFANGTGGEFIECPNTNYDLIRNMSVEEMANFIADIYADNEHAEIRVNGEWLTAEDMEQWLETEV